MQKVLPAVAALLFGAATAYGTEEVLVTAQRDGGMGRAVETVLVTARAEPAGVSAWVAAANKYHLSPLDLYALALQESRTFSSQRGFHPWPWTLNSASEGPLYFDTYEQALKKLRELIARGERNVDVGVMQVSWKYNSYRLPDPAALLLPAQNIDIAAQILRDSLDGVNGNLLAAFARYHNSDPQRGVPYAAAVMSIRKDLERLNVSLK